MRPIHLTVANTRAEAVNGPTPDRVAVISVAMPAIRKYSDPPFPDSYPYPPIPLSSSCVQGGSLAIRRSKRKIATPSAEESPIADPAALAQSWELPSGHPR